MTWNYSELEIELNEFEKSDSRKLILDVRGCNSYLIENIRARIHNRPYLTYSYFQGDSFIQIYKTQYPHSITPLIEEETSPNIKEENLEEKKPNKSPQNEDPWGISDFGIVDFGV